MEKAERGALLYRGGGGGGAASLRLRGMGGEPVARVRSAAGADRSPRGAESDGAVPGRWGWGWVVGIRGGGAGLVGRRGTRLGSGPWTIPANLRISGGSGQGMSSSHCPC